jgi:RimJ/RimL family protein N-acetyltransferase
MEVTLTNWNQALAPELTAACQDPEIQARLPVPVPYLLEHAHYFIDVVAPSFVRDGGANFAVLTPEGTLAGCVSVRPLGDARARLGYWVAPAARGRGVAPAAANAAAQWAFENGFETLLLTIGSDNPASQKVAARAGFSFVEEKEAFEISPGMVKSTVLFARHKGTTPAAVAWPGA